jgi:DNA-binding FrmR family transcriptional regulator
MMFWNGGQQWAFWQVGLMWVGMIAFWGLIVWAVYYFINTSARAVEPPANNESAKRILDERLAHGQIDADQYRHLLDTLSGGPSRRAGVGSWTMSVVAPIDHVSDGDTRQRRGYASGKADYLRRLAKIEGQVRGLQRMVEEDAYCPDIVVQISSATRALQEVAVGLLNDHLEACVVTAARASETQGKQSLDEVAGTIRQVLRL